MRSLSIPKLMVRRLAADWMLLLSVFLGINLAIAILSGAPVYLRSLENLSFKTTIDRASSLILNIYTSHDHIPLEIYKLRNIEDSVEAAIDRNISDIYKGHERYIRTDDALLNPSQTIYEPIILSVQTVNDDSRLAEDEVSLGYFMNLWDLQRQVKFIHGRMASDMVSRDHLGRYEIEAVVGKFVANKLDLDIGDMLTLDSAQGISVRTVVRIVGIVEPIDSTNQYWQGRSLLFFNPPGIENIPDLKIQVDMQTTPLPLMITPEAATKLPDKLVKPVEYIFSRGYFVNLSGLEQHVNFLEGRMATENIIQGPQGPIVEAVVGAPIVNTYKIGLDDVITTTPFVDENTWISARIVGIAERSDLNNDYWQWGPNLFFDPPFEESGGIPPLPLLVSRETMVRAIGSSYPGIQGTSTWAITVDKESLKEWSISQARRSLNDLDNELVRVLSGHQMFTGIRGLLNDLERKAFLASIPVILLLTTMLVTVIYFLLMMVSYLIQHRQGDSALFKTRGISTIQVIKFYVLEGIALTVPACVLGPFLAMGVISLAGKLNYFEQLTDGDLLPVGFDGVPFLVAICAGLGCFFIFVVPSVLSGRTGLIVHKLRSSRPPSEPFFQRYYLDVGLLIVGGLIFFELHSRGQLVVGGLFKDVQINEMLMLGPVLFLIVVALLFMRVFPLVLRFFSGESPRLLHLIMIVTVVGLGGAIFVEYVSSENGLRWVALVSILGGFAGVYWITIVTKQFLFRLSGLVVQLILVSAIFAIERPLPGEVTFIVTGVFISLIFAQILFFLFRGLASRAPVWFAMALWNMARNPLQYAWLVLLLVLTAGLATFSTTVGTTLDKKTNDRVMYEVPSDIRITGLSDYRSGWLLKEKYDNIAGVTTVLPAYLGKAQGPPTLQSDYKFLALDSRNFASISWYRDDFSELSLNNVMGQLRSSEQTKSLYIPQGATRIGVWAKLPQLFSTVKINMLLQDSLGATHIIELGDLEPQKWTILSGEIPTDLKTPLQLVSVQFNPTSSWIGIAGTVVLDNIHVMVGTGYQAQKYIMDDFETEKRWMAIPTSMIISDSVFSITDHAYEGKKAAVYKFGGRSEVRFLGDKRTDVLGIYISPTGGPLPLVASSSFIEAADIDIGETFILKVGNDRIPSVIQNKVDYFPTMDKRIKEFVLADLDLFFEHLNLLTLERISEPNEFFIQLDFFADKKVSQEIYNATPSYGRMLERRVIQQAELASVSFEPLVTVGWRAISVLCLGVVLLLAVIGYATYLLFFAKRNRTEMVLLRSLGFAHVQMVGLLMLEHLFIVFMGLCLGIWAGFQMSILTIPTISMTEGSGSVVPPVLVRADWKILMVTYLTLVTVFVSMLFILKKNIFRLDLQSISKV